MPSQELATNLQLQHLYRPDKLPMPTPLQLRLVQQILMHHQPPIHMLLRGATSHHSNKAMLLRTQDMVLHRISPRHHLAIPHHLHHLRVRKMLGSGTILQWLPSPLSLEEALRQLLLSLHRSLVSNRIFPCLHQQGPTKELHLHLPHLLPRDLPLLV